MRRAILAISVLLATLVPAASASASAAQILRDCELHGHLTGHYTQKELRDALAHLPSDVNEYSDCANVIRTAALAAASGSDGGSNGGDGGTTPGTTGGGTTPGTTGGGTTPGSTGGSAAPSGSGSSPGSSGSSGGGDDESSSTSGDFGGFPDYPKDPLRSASAGDRAAIERAQRSSGAQTVGGIPVVPGTVGSHAGSAGLPVPLIAVLALAAAALLALAALEIRRLVRARGTGDTA